VLQLSLPQPVLHHALSAGARAVFWLTG